MDDRFEQTKKVGLLGIFGNIFLLLLKASVGFIFKSQAMIADAANSAGDIFASFMTFIGNKIASKPQDDTHNFGHGKAEYIFSLFISISMIIVAFKLLYDSIVSLLNNHMLTFSWLLVFTCIITIFIKLSLYLYSKKIAKQQYNILLQSNMKDHRNDCIVTSFTLFSIFCSSLGIYWIDGAVGIGISIWIAFTGFKIFMESYNILMDTSIDDSTKELIMNCIKKYPAIQKTKHFYTTPVGYQYFVVLTIYVDGNMSTFESHAIANQLEKDISNIDKIYHTLVHVNPIFITSD